MIISHSQRFIFIANRKTASTAIGIALSSACNKQDVITPLGEDEEIRRQLGYPKPRNFIPWSKKLAYLSLLTQRTLTGLWISEKLKEVGYYTHITPEKILNFLRPGAWDAYFRFCFVRNPWDLVISHYFWKIRNRSQPLSLDSFLSNAKIEGIARRSREMYTLNSKLAVDRLCRYENAQTEVNQIFEELNLPGNPKLPAAKNQFRNDKRHYRDILNDDQAAKIGLIFKREIELAGYKY
jgi:hypothetical protein